MKLRGIAREALDAFASIAKAAEANLDRSGMTLGAFASINQATAETIARDMRERNDQRVSDCQKLRREPAIARLVVSDEDNNRETLYITSSGTVDPVSVRLCSYMSPKGQLAPPFP